MNKNSAIIIPIYKSEVSKLENISLQQCLKILKNYPIIFLCPENIENSHFYEKYKEVGSFVFIANHNFLSIRTYNEMLLSRWFYQLFSNYTYILIYQLDCFVFKDDLEYWTQKGYSYIGAPWFINNSNNTEDDELIGVGNGGFSLRHVQNHLDVLNSSKKIKSINQCINEVNSKYKLVKFLKGVKNFYYCDSFDNIHKNLFVNEDKIFGIAGKRFNFFKIPLPTQAIDFAFEKQPRKLYYLNDSNLPFGCHAWWKYDLNFYKPILKSFGFHID